MDISLCAWWVRIILTVEVLEVSHLYALTHAENVGCGADAVESHPQVTSVQSAERLSRSAGSLTEARQSMLDVCPCGYQGAQNHQTEGEESHGCDRATEPEDLSICDQDNSKVLEDSVDWDRKILQRPRAGVDHADEEEGDGEP